MALCSDCANYGQCSLSSKLSNQSIPLRRANGVVQPKPHASISPDLENWQPVKFVHDPYAAEKKLKHETCPFHRLKSVGWVADYFVYVYVETLL